MIIRLSHHIGWSDVGGGDGSHAAWVLVHESSEVFDAAAAPGAVLLLPGHGKVHDAANVGAAVALWVVPDANLIFAKVVVDANVVAQLMSKSLMLEKMWWIIQRAIDK